MKTSTDSRSRVHLYALIAASLALMLLAGVGIYGLPTGPTPPAAHSSAATPPSTAPTAHANPSPTVAKPSAVKGSRNPDVFTWDTTGRVLVIVVTLVLSRGGTDVAFYEYRGIIYPRRGLMCAAKRARYIEVLNQGLNFTQAASAAGVSKHTGKVWRNGRTRSTGRNEHASVDWYRKPRPISSRYLSQVERITMASRSARRPVDPPDRPASGSKPVEHQPRDPAQHESRQRTVRAASFSDRCNSCSPLPPCCSSIQFSEHAP